VIAAAGPRKAKEAVKDVLLRGGATTGYFDGLSTQIHVQIFSLVDLKTRLALTMETCRGFRDLQQQPGVWDNLIIPCLGTGWRDSKGWITGVGVRRLLANIPVASVEHLDLRGDSCGARDIEHVMKSLPSLRRLGLHGKRVKGNVVTKAIANSSWIGKLQHLDLNDAKLDEESIFTVLRAAPSLTHLVLVS
jgi:hypothetical protein